MFTPRTAARTIAILGAAAALAFAGAGAASATTADNKVTDHTVSVTFTLEDGRNSDACGAALIPATAGLDILQGLNPDTSDIEGILNAVDKIDGVKLLKNGQSPLVSLTEENRTGTVSRSDVAPGPYGVISLCTSKPTKPALDAVFVGNPLNIISGLSSGGGLDTLSSMIGGGQGEIGLDTLSSAVGGGAGADD